jgi:hypothetical protein
MRVRDRLILGVIAAVIVVGAVWLVLVSPERSKASNLGTQIATEHAALASAQASLAAAKATAAGYPADVAAISHVMTAVPPDPQESNIVTTITKLAGSSVDVHEITVGGAAATGTGPVSIGLTFTFKTTYSALESFIAKLDNLLKTDGTNIDASGRAFTVNSVSLEPLPPNKTTATVTVAAYAQNPAAPVAAATTTPTTSTGATSATGATGATGATTPTP